MRVVLELLVSLAVVVTVVLVVLHGLRRTTAVLLERRERRAAAAPWRPEVITEPDGTLVVQIRRPGQVPRVVKRLSPDLVDADLVSEIRLALEEADNESFELNNPVRVSRPKRLKQ